MIQTDTIKGIIDSAKVLTTDTLPKLDSLVKADSIATVDTIKAVVHVAPVPTGFVGIPLPSLPQTDGWIFGILLLLFLLFVLSTSQSPGIIFETIKTFFQVKERSSIFSKKTIVDFRFRFFLILFSIGIFSLYAYLVIQNPSTLFSIEKYGYFLLITTVFLGLKSVLFDIMGYVFLEPKSYKMAKASYFNVFSFIGIAIFPLLILRIYTPYFLNNLPDIISLFICLIGYILIIIKLFQIFFHKTVASFYILLYLCTLEFLPLIALYRVYQLIV